MTNILCSNEQSLSRRGISGPVSPAPAPPPPQTRAWRGSAATSPAPPASQPPAAPLASSAGSRAARLGRPPPRAPRPSSRVSTGGRCPARRAAAPPPPQCPPRPPCPSSRPPPRGCGPAPAPPHRGLATLHWDLLLRQTVQVLAHNLSGHPGGGPVQPHLGVHLSQDRAIDEGIFFLLCSQRSKDQNIKTIVC